MSTEALAGAVACTSSNNPYGAHPMAKSGGLDLCDDTLSNADRVECFMDRVCDSTIHDENSAIAVVNTTTSATNDWVIFVSCNDSGTTTTYCAVYEDTYNDRTGLAVYGTVNDDLIQFQDPGASTRVLDKLPSGVDLEGFASGGGGNDVLTGSTSTNSGYTDILSGGSGLDRLFGRAGNDKLYGGGDNDYLHAGDGADLAVEGNDGDDVIVAGGGADPSVDGNAGHDFICGHTENNEPNGADSFAIAPYAGSTEDPATWPNATSNPFTCAETGATTADTIRGGAGDDRIWSANGSDTVSGGSGQDFIYLGAGDDQACDPMDADDKVYGQDGGDDLFAVYGSFFLGELDGGGQSGDTCSGATGGLTVTDCPGTPAHPYTCP